MHRKVKFTIAPGLKFGSSTLFTPPKTEEKKDETKKASNRDPSASEKRSTDDSPTASTTTSPTPVERGSEDAAEIPSLEDRITLSAKLHLKFPTAEFVKASDVKEQTVPIIRSTATPKEKEVITGRMTWSDAHSATNTLNEKHRAEHRANLILQLKGWGYEEPEKLLDRMILFLQERAFIVYTFNASFLAKEPGLTNLQISHMFEFPKGKTEADMKARKEAESSLFAFLEYFYSDNPDFSPGKEYRESKKGELAKRFKDNNHSRPRYAEYAMTDATRDFSPIDADGFAKFGRSCVILTPLARLNSLFAASDSLNHREEKKDSYKLCTYHHFETLLAQFSLEKLNGLARRVTTGLFTHSLPRKGLDLHLENGYTEALISPGIDITNPAFVESIFVSAEECKLDPSVIDAFKARGINIINTDEATPYTGFRKKLWDLLEKNPAEVKEIEALIQQFRLVIFSTNMTGEEPLHIAAKRGDTHLAKLLLKYGAKPSDLLPNGKTAADVAKENGHPDLFREYMQAQAAKEQEVKEAMTRRKR